MAWSEAARRAAIEARQRHHGSHSGGTPNYTTSAYSPKFKAILSGANPTKTPAQQRLAHGFAQTEVKRYERIQRSGYALSPGERQNLASHRSFLKGK